MTAAPRLAPPSAAPFDAAAASYDQRFAHTRLGRSLRARVHRHLERCFAPGDRVLELGCGTGEDALWLARRGVEVLATDRSSAMLEVAAAKLAQAGLEGRVRLAGLDASRLDAESPLPAEEPGRFDGALASFGVLNCLRDRTALAAALARWIRPGGTLVVVVMGPCCLWEIGWQLLHASPRRATRRWRGGDPARLAGGATIEVWYPTPRRLARDFSPHFRTFESAAIGVALPPSDLAGLVERSPRRLAALERCDGWLSRLPGAPWVADHYLLALERNELAAATQ